MLDFHPVFTQFSSFDTTPETAENKHHETVKYSRYQRVLAGNVYGGGNVLKFYACYFNHIR